MPLKIKRAGLRIPVSLPGSIKPESATSEEYLTPEEVFTLVDHYYVRLNDKLLPMSEEEKAFYVALFGEPILSGIARLKQNNFVFHQKLFEQLVFSYEQNQLESYLTALVLLVDVLGQRSNISAGQIVFQDQALKQLAFYVQYRKLNFLLTQLHELTPEGYGIIFPQIAIRIICSDPHVSIDELQLWLPIDIVLDGIEAKLFRGNIEIPFDRTIADQFSDSGTASVAVQFRNRETSADRRAQIQKLCRQYRGALFQICEELRRIGITFSGVYAKVCSHDVDFIKLARVFEILRTQRLDVLPLISDVATHIWNIYHDHSKWPDQQAKRVALKQVCQEYQLSPEYISAQVERILYGSCSFDEFVERLQLPLREPYRRVIDVAMQGQLFQFSPILEYLSKQSEDAFELVPWFLQNYCGAEYNDPDYFCPVEMPVVGLIDPRRTDGNPYLDRLSRLLPPEKKAPQAERQMLARLNPQGAEGVFYLAHSDASLLLDERIKEMLRESPEMIKRVIENPHALRLIDAQLLAPDYPDKAAIREILNFSPQKAESLLEIITMPQKAARRVLVSLQEERLLTFWRLKQYWDNSSFTEQRVRLKALSEAMQHIQSDIRQAEETLLATQSQMQRVRAEIEVLRSSAPGAIVEEGREQSHEKGLRISLDGLQTQCAKQQKKVTTFRAGLLDVESRLKPLEQFLFGSFEQDHELALHWLNGSLSDSDLQTRLSARLTMQQQQAESLVTSLRSAGITDAQLADAKMTSEEIIRLREQNRAALPEQFYREISQYSEMRLQYLRAILRSIEVLQPSSLDSGAPSRIPDPREYMQQCYIALMALTEDEARIFAHIANNPNLFRRPITLGILQSKDIYFLLTGEETVKSPGDTRLQRPIYPSPLSRVREPQSPQNPASIQGVFLRLQQEHILLTRDLYERIMFSFDHNQIPHLFAILSGIGHGADSANIVALIQNYCGYDDDRFSCLCQYLIPPPQPAVYQHVWIHRDGRNKLITNLGFFYLLKAAKGMSFQQFFPLVSFIEQQRDHYQSTELYGAFKNVWDGVKRRQDTPGATEIERTQYQLAQAMRCFKSVGEKFPGLDLAQADFVEIGQHYHESVVDVAALIFDRLAVKSEQKARFLSVLIEYLSAFSFKRAENGGKLSSEDMAKQFMGSSDWLSFMNFIKTDNRLTRYEEGLSKRRDLLAQKISRRENFVKNTKERQEIDEKLAIMCDVHKSLRTGSIADRIRNFTTAANAAIGDKRMQIHRDKRGMRFIWCLRHILWFFARVLEKPIPHYKGMGLSGIFDHTRGVKTLLESEKAFKKISDAPSQQSHLALVRGGGPAD